jgi:DNA-binding transcriptional LysR family regulator
MPRRIEDLRKHQCVLFPVFAPKGVWTFRQDGRKYSVQVSGVFETDEMDAVRAAVVAGLGISPLPVYMVADALRQRQLIPMLRKFQIAPESAIYLVYLPNRTLSSRVRALIDFLAERFGPVPPWEVGW